MLEWWDPANPTDDSIWYEKEQIVEPNEEDYLWYRDDSNEKEKMMIYGYRKKFIT